MPFRMGPTELIIVLVIVLVLFGVGRIGKIGGELGKGISAFRSGLKEEPEHTSDDDKSDDDKAEDAPST